MDRTKPDLDPPISRLEDLKAQWLAAAEIDEYSELTMKLQQQITDEMTREARGIHIGHIPNQRSQAKEMGMTKSLSVLAMAYLRSL